MRERRINGTYDALCRRQVASWWATATLQEVQFRQCGILRSAFYQFFKTTLDIGICACPPCAVCLFFKPDYAKDPDAHSTKTALDWYE